jgi:hypothetical protein
MSDHHGNFVWYELMTTDPQAAAAFYADVVGWRVEDAHLSTRPYHLFYAGDAAIGGLLSITATDCAPGVGPNWGGYVAVADVDATVERLIGLGGTVHRPPADIAGVGRFAVVADPQAAVFMLFHGKAGTPLSADNSMTPGRVSWHELTVADGDKAFPFYRDLFGWTELEALDMGPEGFYRMFAIDGTPAGGMMSLPPAAPVPPGWTFYVAVPSVTEAVKRILSGGGKLLTQPVEVPGGSVVVKAVDPQGAVFALVSHA